MFTTHQLPRPRRLPLRHLLPIAGLALLLAIAQPASSAPAGDGWGVPDGGSHPQSGQLIRFDAAGNALGGCSGTLVSPTVFVTAGHCAIRKQQNPGMDLWVTFDSTWTKTHPPIARYRVAYAVAAPTVDLGVEVLETPVPGIDPADLPALGALDRLLAATTDHPDLTVVGYGQGGNVNDRNDDPQPWTESVRRRATVEALWVDSTDVRTRGLGDHPSTGCAGNSGGGMFRPGTDDLVALMWASNPICSGYLLGTRLDTAAARDFLAGFVAVP
jgi:hypothetical protein